MQEWIIAMLVISVLLILRDMAKTIFSEMKKSAATLAYDQHPQKEKCSAMQILFKSWRTASMVCLTGKIISPVQRSTPW